MTKVIIGCIAGALAVGIISRLAFEGDSPSRIPDPSAELIADVVKAQADEHSITTSDASDTAPVRVASSAAASIGVSRSKPVQITEAHTALLNGDILDRHRQLESEDQENPWSYDAEYKLKALLSETVASPEFDIVHVECRKTLCEIQAFAYGELSQERWQQLVENRLHQQPWGHQFPGTWGRRTTIMDELQSSCCSSAVIRLIPDR